MSHLEKQSPIFYTYNITCLSDLQEDVFKRRLVKARQAQANHIYLILQKELTIDQIFLQNLNEFLNKINTHNLTMSLEIHLSLLALILPEPSLQLIENIYFVVQNEVDFKNVVTFLNNMEKGNFSFSKFNFMLQPRQQKDFLYFIDHFVVLKNLRIPIYWKFEPYHPEKNYHLTIRQIFNLKNKFEQLHQTYLHTLKGLEVFNNFIPSTHELEPVQNITWQFQTAHQEDVLLSVIIPTYNNTQFLSNVIYHLIQQNTAAETYEIIIIDDGSVDNCSEIIWTTFKSYQNKLNLKYIYWSKHHPDRGSQNFFRAGLARNLGVQHSRAEQLFFLDSDMLVPNDFIQKSVAALKKYDVIQFKRRHIHQKKSFANPLYTDIKTTDSYIEEATYWNNLFLSSSWQNLSNHWKYTCTYALGLKKSDFLSLGRFKKYYVSYGLEDTDLGYELYRRNKKFHLVDDYLLHLTSYNSQQYKNSYFKKRKLLKKTSRLFFLQHLDPEIYHTFYGFYRNELPFFKSLQKFFTKD